MHTMAEPGSILVVGGYGVFGRLLVRELLAHTRARVVVAGRRLEKARAAAAAAGAHGALGLDLGTPGALEHAARGFAIVACAAGPFAILPHEAPREAVAAGAHWIDIADDPDWVLDLLADPALAASERAVMPGQSTVPALSGTLLRWCSERLDRPTRARITLYIGNRNAKGAGAIAAAIAARFRDPENVSTPTGDRLAWRFHSPDAALHRPLNVEARVALEWPVSGRLVAAAGRLPGGIGRTAARGLAVAAAPLRLLGTADGSIQAEVWDADGRRVAAALTGGQSLAVLPATLAAEALLGGSPLRGAVSPHTWMAPVETLSRAVARGARFSRSV
jgi:hypothetical protein